jgi:hypothetical protein
MQANGYVSRLFSVHRRRVEIEKENGGKKTGAN